MERLITHITIGQFTFDYVNNLTVESTWMELTDKATITLPANLKLDKTKLKSLVPKGAAVEIKTGYNDRLKTIFKGFVARVHPITPIKIDCEDLMWQLKQIEVNSNCSNELMGDYVARIQPYPVDAFNVTVPKFIAHRITAAQVLNELRSNYGLQIFVRNGKITIGKQYDPSNYSTHIVQLENNFNSNVKKNELEYTSKDDVKLKVTAISNQPDGTKLEVELGDPDGEKRTLNFYNLSKSDLKALAEKEIERLRYDGYRGNLVLFGEPTVYHGDVIEIRNDADGDKAGRYWVDGVTYEFGVGGYQQTVKLGART